jgi:hypothetical protein
MSDVAMARAFEAIVRGLILCAGQVILGMCFGLGVAVMLTWWMP